MGCSGLMLLLLLFVGASGGTAKKTGSREGLMVTYWGQKSIEGNLSTACETGNYDILIIAFLNVFGRGIEPQLDLENHCNPAYGGCLWVSDEIETCQGLGIKVFLSIGGAVGFYDLTSDGMTWNSLVS